ncbi:unnamed protein product [Merluccius merluccius]
MHGPCPGENEGPLLLPSLRLFVPPLRLVSAAMWQVVQRGDVQDYGMLEEFITTVTEIVPELLNADQKAQLLLGLRARVVLDLCRADQITEIETIEMHLERIKSIISTWASQPYFAEVQFPESTFVNHIESLLKDPKEREKFFQDEFPVDFGPDYDAALQTLVLDFLSRLERLLPVPDLQHTASLLDAVPSALEECLQSVPDPQQLRTVLQYHTTLGHSDLDDESQSLPSSFGNCILSSLSLPQLEKLVIDGEQFHLQAPSTPLHGCVTVQLEGETVTLLDYIQIQQQPASVEEGALAPDAGEGHAPAEESQNDQEDPDPLKPASFQPLKQSKRLQLKRRALKEQKDSYSPTRKRTRRKYPNNKTCPVCNKNFLRATAMRRHLEIHSDNRQLKYKCPNCEKRFRDQYDMTRHNMRVHERDEEFDDEAEEEEVEEEAADAATAAAAATPAAEDPGPSDAQESKHCTLCGKYFARRVDMDRHIKSHSEDRPHKCPYCEKCFKHPYVLKRHQKEICKSKDLKRASWADDGGGGGAPDAAADALALSPAAEAPADSKVCPVCSRTLPCTADIAKHLRSHTEERPYVCVGCEKGFKYKDTLKKHQLIHGHEGVREEQCKSVEEILAQVDRQGKKVGDVCTVGGEGEGTAAATTTTVVVLEPRSKRALKTCPVCARAFDNVKNLNKHMRCHTEERPFHCVHCKRRFKHMHSLKRHQIYAICQKKIMRLSSVKKELKTAAAAVAGGDGPQGAAAALKIPVWCSNCGQHFEYPAALREHQESACKVEFKEVMRCDDCGKEFKSMTLLKVHQRIHAPLYCKECGKILASEAAFERHKLMHKPIGCTMCGKTFTLLRRLREHYEKQHDFSGPYPCAQCGKSFAQLPYLAAHERVHSGEFPYACAACPEKFRSSNCLTVHQRKHTGEKPFLCWQCGKRYRSASELTVHMGTHSEARPWACAQCDAAYRTKLQLTNHVEQVHIGVRYPCDTCGKQFMKEVSLKRHELIHTGERPHQCTDCGKTFLTANELRLHTRYHTGERPYKCDLCDKAFIQSGYLKSHMRIHTGEKPFKCDICDKGFRLSYHMKKHRRTHSGKPKSHACEQCGLAFTHKKSLCEHALTHEVKMVAFTQEVRIEFQ